MPRGPSKKTVDDRMAKLGAWATRMDSEMKAGFARMAAMRAKAAAEPRMRRIWP